MKYAPTNKVSSIYCCVRSDVAKKGVSCVTAKLPVDQLVKQQALIEVFKLALLHPAAPLQLHMAIHARVISPSTLFIPVTHMGCSINKNVMRHIISLYAS